LDNFPTSETLYGMSFRCLRRFLRERKSELGEYVMCELHIEIADFLPGCPQCAAEQAAVEAELAKTYVWMPDECPDKNCKDPKCEWHFPQSVNQPMPYESPYEDCEWWFPTSESVL
jgi:hypothetical protein